MVASNCLLFVMLLLPFTAFQELAKPSIRGVVRSVEGRPLEGVKVINVIGKGDSTTTESGSFVLHVDRAVVMFLHPSYDPSVQVFTAHPVEKEVRLVHRRSEAHSIRTCTSRLREPVEIRFRRPRDATSFRDVDHSGYGVEFAQRGGREKMTVWTTVVSYGYPNNTSWWQDLSNFQVKWVACGTSQGLDIRARTGDGRYSRWFGLPNSYAEYSRVSKDAAAYFDRIAATACCY